MKILLISNCPLQYHQGSGYVILNVSDGLRKLGHNIESYGPECYEPLKNFNLGKSYKVAVGMLFFCVWKLVRGTYDVVIFYGAEAWLTLIFLKFIFRLKILMVSNSNGLETRYLDVMKKYFGHLSYDNKAPKWYQLDQRRLYRMAFTLSDGIITNNEKDRLYAVKNGYKSNDRVATVDLGIEEEFLNLRPTFNNSKILGFCGSWIRRKGTDLICQDIGQILREYNEYKLILVGVGDQFKKEDFFENDISDRLIVYPQLKTKKELIKIYSQMSIFLLPSIHESFGLVMCEAMACGCALVASDTGFASRLTKEEAVVFSSLRSPELYKSVKYLIENEDIRRKIAINGYKRTQGLHWEQSIKEIESTYLKWIV